MSYLDQVAANPYPFGYVLTYTNEDGKVESTVLSLGRNRFATLSGTVYPSYDSWLDTLPQRAQSDMGIKEYETPDVSFIRSFNQVLDMLHRPLW